MNHAASLFGTDGIRTRIGTSPLTPHELTQLGYAIGVWALERYGSGAKILLGTDTRASADWMYSALAAGLLLNSIELVHAGVMPTPAVFLLTQKSSYFYDAGIVITASHNEHWDNGIKIIDHIAGKITAADEIRITELFYAGVTPTYALFGKVGYWNDAHTAYTQALREHIPTLDLTDTSIVLDCAHGALSSIAPDLLRSYGATVHTLNASPTGTNINSNGGANNPRVLQEAIRTYNGTIGFAFDGDGDRVTIVNKAGMVKNGDDILALLSMHPAYADSGTVIGTEITNEGLAHFFSAQNKVLKRTPVGDKYIAQALQATHQTEALLGGEQAGHILMRDFQLCSDGLFTALRILEYMYLSGNSMLDSFTHLPETSINIRTSYKPALTDGPLADILQCYQEKIVQAAGRLIVRYSGTEPLLRIQVQAADKVFADTLAHDISYQLTTLLDSLKQKDLP